MDGEQRSTVPCLDVQTIAASSASVATGQSTQANNNRSTPGDSPSKRRCGTRQPEQPCELLEIGPRVGGGIEVLHEQASCQSSDSRRGTYQSPILVQ